jgi:hypothetical protein
VHARHATEWLLRTAAGLSSFSDSKVVWQAIPKLVISTQADTKTPSAAEPNSPWIKAKPLKIRQATEIMSATF